MALLWLTRFGIELVVIESTQFRVTVPYSETKQPDLQNSTIYPHGGYMKKNNTTTSQTAPGQDQSEELLYNLLDNLRTSPDLDRQVQFPPSSHIQLGLTRIGLSRILYYHGIYRQILGVPGVICEFGVRFGDTLSLLTNLRGILEPYNFTRKLIGFDTFEGFPSIHANDTSLHEPGECTVPADYEKSLERILQIHEGMAPVSHIRKHELVKGDVSGTFSSWLKRNPGACVALAIFDMDLYHPTHQVLEAILPRMPKGSVLVFDEFCYDSFPGESMAVQEVLGIHNLRMRSDHNQPTCAWCVVGE